ncbi:DeoR/GlpR family DNA-binding transcription regulator [Tessaracoccus sp. Z1128]
MRPQIRVVLTGGVARTNSFELVGPLAALILPEIHIDLFFLGVNAVDTDRCAFYTHTEDEATINAGMMQVASRTVVPADASKIGRTAFARIGAFTDVSALITDSRITAEASERLHAQGVEVILP